ncbi:quinone-dependent dihydroorotate dehydrogenase [Chitinimonas sp. BJB300]|uniref:quinone-dependent dihydroorotate dehydrogenase n=1 Tax=Chitinimonas sp. BJB300 TaxID=1559339 RepID=UPI000C10E405|nr:quinone-dependent dihydroorotate dehydrogenase [Chitinimonas sp. BJB300]PHV12177.1 dihydroorotate dehydrogenase (quinone) [Chitinimonas sp. BJB300]TSJ91582.1 quinone-dependent dihydroorotate dehydrogenase [Chitinimonas sp. BJB300]
MLYPLLRPLLFSLEPEKAHKLTFAGLEALHALGFATVLGSREGELPTQCMGLRFPNPVGVSAGLDKNGEHIDALADLGFGFIEIGTVTPRPQPGNPSPRMFRLPGAEGIINRLGFNNGGLDALVSNVEASQYSGVLGINIGKNFDTPIESANDDYLACLTRVYPYASYITVNISSPNTKNLRQLQQSDELERLLSVLKNEQSRLATQHGRYVPLALKIAPDLETDQIHEIARLLIEYRFDGVIATNTTLSRVGVEHIRHGQEMGGLSGTPVRAKSTVVIRALSAALSGRVPIIGVGGILEGSHAAEKIEAGASLIQLYSGLIYRGPGLVAESIRAIAELKD